MIYLDRDSTKRIFTGNAPSGSGNYYLLDFYCAGTELHVYCVCTDVNAGSGRPVELVVVETGDDAPTPTSGEVRLLPVGQWKLNVYRQSSSSNLVTSNATYFWSDTVYVRGTDQGTEYTGSVTSGSCPLTVPITVDGTLMQTLTGVNPCVANTVNIAITYS